MDPSTFSLGSRCEIICFYRNTEQTWDIAENDFVLGRAHENSPPLLDLSPYVKISRVHAKVWKEDGAFWIEDSRSTHGSPLNGVEIKGTGKQLIHTGDQIVAGDTTLRIESLEPEDSFAQTNYLEFGAKLPADEHREDLGVKIAHDLDATDFDPAPPIDSGNAGALRLKLICELPLQFAAKTELRDLLPTIVDRLVDLIPNAENWALALRDPKTNALLLKAHRSRQRPHISETLSRRAMDERKAFIWNKTVPGDVSGTILQSAINTGMYAPLLWQDEAFGRKAWYLGATNGGRTSDFRPSDQARNEADQIRRTRGQEGRQGIARDAEKGKTSPGLEERTNHKGCGALHS